MLLTQSQRHKEICQLEWDVYPTLREQYAEFESYRRVRLAELERMDAASGLTEAEHEARRRYLREWNQNVDFQSEFRSFDIFAAYRRACDRGLVKDEQFVRAAR